jgi:hypothetical protein
MTPAWLVAARGNMAALLEAFPHRRGHVRHQVERDDGARRAIVVREVSDAERPDEGQEDSP